MTRPRTILTHYLPPFVLAAMFAAVACAPAAAASSGGDQNVFQREPLGATLSLAMIVAGIGLLIWRHRRRR